jgi:hypothetical protein
MRLAPVVGIESQHGKRQQLAHPLKCLDDPGLVAIEERQAFRPSGGDIRQGQRVQVGSLGLRSTMGNQIGF